MGIEEEYKRIHQDVAKQAALDNYFKNQKELFRASL